MPDSSPQPMNLFRLTERGLSAQMVRMNAAASNLANAGSVASTSEEAYRSIRPVFGAELDRASGLASVRVSHMVTSNAEPTRRHDPDHPLADENGDVWEASVDESGEMVEIMESARQYQNLVEALQTAKTIDARDIEEIIMTPITPDSANAIDRLNQPGPIRSNNSRNTLGQADFLLLLTTQLQNQDPTKPQNNEAMIAQMAQFSSLEASVASNATLEDIATKLDALIALQGSGNQTEHGFLRDTASKSPYKRNQNMTSFYTSLNALRNAETDLSVIAHNIANAETLAFKSRSVQFADIVAGGSGNDPRLSVGLGATVSTINQDFSLGAIEQTGRSLDVAIDSEGFFAVRNRETNELTFTRNGNFQIDSDGNIENARGQPIQTFALDPVSGLPLNTTPIDTQVPTVSANGSDLSSVTIEGSGNLLAAYADGEIVPVGRLAIATFASNDGLLAIGEGRNRATGVSGEPQFESPGVGNRGAILSGALERSNVDLAEEMVSLITAQRNFQANARAIDTATTISQTVINLQG